MYIKDLQTIGASFMIMDVTSTKRTLFGRLILYCRGELKYHDEIFYLEVTQKNNDLMKIQYVCSDDKEDAARKFSRLHEIFNNGLKKNVNNIRFIYRHRVIKKFLYHVTILMGLCGMVLSMKVYLSLHKAQYLFISCAFLLGLLIARHLKYRFIFH